MKDFDEWAHQISVDSSFPIAKSDREIAKLATAGEKVVRIESGNIFRTLGGREGRKPPGREARRERTGPPRQP